MKYEDRTKEQLIEEIEKLRRCIGDLESADADQEITEQALRQSEERYRALVENTKDVVYSTDHQGALTYISPQVERYGYSPGELIGRNLMEFIAPEDLQSVMEAFASSMSAGTEVPVQLRIVDSQGRKHWVEEDGRVQSDEDGNYTGVTGVLRNIEDRKKAERALRDSESKYLSLVENSKDTIIIHQDGMVRFVNAAVFELSGYTSDEIIGKNITRFVAPEYQAFVTKRYAARAAGMEVPAIYEIDLVRKDGSVVPVEINASIIDYQGVSSALVFIRDITERRQAEIALRASEKKFRMIFENASDEITILDADGTIISVNSKVRDLFGYSPEEVTGRNIAELGLFEPEDVEGIMNQFRDVIQGEEPELREIKARRRDGSTVFIEASGNIIRVNDEEIRIVAIIRDVTQRRLMEDEQRRLSTEIEAKNRELEQIINIASHDLRSPLVNIQGFGRELERSVSRLMEIMKQEGIPGEIRADVQSVLGKDVPESLVYIEKSVRKMDSLLKGLLSLSRLGRASMSITNLDMNAMLGEIVDAFEFRIKETGAVFDIGRLPSCRGDEVQIYQVFSNLVDNALKYLDPARDGVIRISGKKEKALSIYCIEDNGIGIQQENLERIFEIFHQLDPESGDGEGLGLAIVKRILTRHDGGIRVESEPGKGSRFEVSLPVGSTG